MSKTAELLTGDMNISYRFRQAISEAVRHSKHSREEICALIFGLTGGMRVTKAYFDQMSSTAASKATRRFPCEILPAFCAITGDLTPLSILAESAGCTLLDRKKSEMLEIVELSFKKEKIETQIKELKAKI